MPVAVCKICSQLGSDSETIVSQLQKILPQEFHHELCSYESLGGDNFKCTLRLKLTTEGEANNWLKAFQGVSFMTWRVMKTYPDAGRFNKYRVDLRCQHNTRPKPGTTPKKPGKDTQCPAMMYLIVKRSLTSRNRCSRSRDQHIQGGFYFTVNLRNQHNHDLLAAEFMRKRDVSKETVDTLKELYRKGHTPSSALDTLKHNLREEFGDNYNRVVDDRAICPDLQYCYRLYYNMTKQTNGTSTEEMFKNLEGRLTSYNQEHNSTCVEMKQIDNESVMAICTPLMRSVHVNMDRCAEMVFVDSSINTGRNACYLLILLAHTAIGGLPLGVVVTTSQTESIIKAGLELLQSVFPAGAFYGRGASGPQATVTQDCSPLRKAIQAVYPTTQLMLCMLRILQSTWQWLWDGSNEIAAVDRPALFSIVNAMVHAGSSIELDEKYRSLLQQEIVRKYAKFQEYLSKLYQSRTEWAVHCQDQRHVSGQSDLTNNLTRSAMHVFKDKILHRIKNYDIGQLVDFILKRIDVCYERRVLEVTKKGMSASMDSRYFVQGRDLNRSAITQVAESYYTVPNLSSGQEHLVNMDLGMCTCPVGMKGGPCKHQHAVIKKFKLENFDLSSPLSPQHMKAFSNIVTGRVDNARSSGDVVLEPGNTLDLSLSTSTVESVETEVALEIIAASAILERQDLQPSSLGSPRGLQVTTEHSCATPGVSKQKEAGTPLEERLRKVFHTIGDKLQGNPGVYRTAVKSFVSSFERLQSDSALVSSLYTFGKLSGEMAAAKRLKVAARKSLQRASQLGAQPSDGVGLES